MVSSSEISDSNFIDKVINSDPSFETLFFKVSILISLLFSSIFATYMKGLRQIKLYSLTRFFFSLEISEIFFLLDFFINSIISSITSNFSFELLSKIDFFLLKLIFTFSRISKSAKSNSVSIISTSANGSTLLFT